MHTSRFFRYILVGILSTLVLFLFADSDFNTGSFGPLAVQLETSPDVLSHITSAENATYESVISSPEFFKFKQPDGTVFYARQFGGANYNWMEDRKGFTIGRNSESRYYEFLDINKKGEFFYSGLRVGKHNPANSELRKHIRENNEVITIKLRRLREKAKFISPASSFINPIGTAKKLVILVNFSDTTPVYSQSVFDSLFNAPGYSSNGAQGSVWDYYNEVSYGLLDVQTTVSAWITLNKTAAYYGSNDYTSRPREMVSEALLALDASGFDFSPFDNDGNGYIDCLAVIHQGRGEEAGGGANTIWSHAWAINTLTLDGVKISQYYTAPEKYGSSLTTIGVLCHEFGHILGLPDLYDTDGSSSGVGNWGLMGGGTWNNTGRTPAHILAWGKAKLGWLTPTVLSSDQNDFTLLGLHDNAVAYKITHGMASNEYILLENRQKLGFDASLPGSGLIATHIDDSQYSNRNENRYLVGIMQADGLKHLENNYGRGDASDTFPGSSNNQYLEPYTNPGSNSYLNGFSGIYIENIDENTSAKTVSFDLDLMENEAPTNVSVSPSNGSGGSQTFTVVYDDINGHEDFSLAHMLINTERTFTNAVYLYYRTSDNKLFLRDNNNTSWGTGGACGSNITLSNSQVSISLASSSLVKSADRITLQVQMSFKSTFVGDKKIYVYSKDKANNKTGWQQKGSFSVTNTKPVNVSVTPSSGSGSSQTFSVVYQDVDGHSDISLGHLLINTSRIYTNAAYLYYRASDNKLFLRNDANSSWGMGYSLGSSGSLSNGQVSISTAGCSAVKSGDTITLHVPMTFKGSFAGAKNTYMYCKDKAGNKTGWQQKGTFTVSNNAPANTSITPTNGSGSSQTFSVVYTDTDGHANISLGHVLINTSRTYTNAVYLYYRATDDKLFLRNDANSSWGMGYSLGSSGSLSNGQVSISTAGCSAVKSGNTITLHVPMTFKGSFAGAKNTYMYCKDKAGNKTGWQQKGSFTVTNTKPVNVSVSPSAGSGSSNTFTVIYSDVDGNQDIELGHVLINTSRTFTYAAYLYFRASDNKLFLRNNANSSWGIGHSIGSNTTLSNNQVYISMNSASIVKSGNTITLKVPVYFRTSFIGVKEVWLYCKDKAGNKTGWQKKSNFTVTN